MYPRLIYEVTQDDLNTLLEAMTPSPVMIPGGFEKRSAQEKANFAWARLGEKMGFDPATVYPPGRCERFFSAVPSEI